MDLSAVQLLEEDPDQTVYRECCREIVRENCEFWCLCYKNPVKYTSMTHRFRALGLELHIYGGVPPSDPRITITPERPISRANQRLWSVTYGHLDMIQRFYDSRKPYGLFCEDDIVVSRALPYNLPFILSECNEAGIECLLLGYMKTFKVEGWMAGHATRCAFPDRPYTYHAYPQDQWGVHLYMLSRVGAKKILDAYAAPMAGSAGPYADRYRDDPDKPFSPDWTITKCPGLSRALISPMFACEDGADPYEHYAHDGQYNFHMETFRANYVPGLFI